MKREQKSPCTLKSLTDLAEQVPFNIVLIDRNYNVIDANRQFKECFGEWKGKHCFETFKGRSSPCSDCRAMQVFGDGCVQVIDEEGRDRQGQPCHSVVHIAPIRNTGGEITHVLRMSTTLATTKNWQERYNLLFDRVPCYITVIDRNYQITRTNEKFSKSFGEAVGKPCFKAFKGFDSPCPECPAKKTFDDGNVHVSRHIGRYEDGSTAHYIMTTAPLAVHPDGIRRVIEIATDITTLVALEGELRQTYDLYESLLHNTASGVLALNEQDQTIFINRGAREILQWTENMPPSKEKLLVMLPARFFEQKPAHNDPIAVWKEATVRTAENNEVPVLFRTAELNSGGMKLGRGAFFRDLRPMKKLEKEKLDAERLAAVGQTVAGLAHTIKNLLMGLEGGMYLVDTGMKKGDVERIAEGWDVLQTNFEKTTTLVKDFLSFAKGRLPDLRVIDPNALVRNIYDLYRETASQQGVRLVLDLKENIDSAWLDIKGIEASLTNMLSNGIDAVILRGDVDGQVVLRTRDEGDDLIFEVEDNGCGMDWEVKQKIFTTFFTTKGGEGTGLGLLTTRKIIQEHFGKIEVDTKEGIGTTFRARLPRSRLKELAGKKQASCKTGKETPYGS
jgi:PAS domain S-box-containing protein